MVPAKPMESSAAGPPSWLRALRRVAAPRRPSGAVRCEDSSAMPPTPEPNVLPSPPPPASTKEDAPVHFEMMSREWSQMSQQDNWDGFRMEAVTPVTKHLQAAHTLFLGTQLREAGYIYQFGPFFQSEGQRTVITARAGLDGAVNGRWIQKIGTGFELKASSATHLKDMQRNMHDASLEYTGKDWTCGAKVAWQGAWLGGGSFTQRVLPSLTLGGDLTFVAVNNIMTIGQLGVRWAEGKDVVTLGVSQQPSPKTGSNVQELRAQYVRRLSDRLSLGAELKLSRPDKESGLSMCYEYAFRNARIQGLLDTDGKVSCCVSDYQGLGFTGMIDYARSDYKFGVLMHIMPPDQNQPM